MLQTSAVTITGVLGICMKFGALHGPASPELKPLPVTAMMVPTGAELGVKVIVGVVGVTMKRGSEISPVIPFT
jgi:hypothetical protein